MSTLSRNWAPGAIGACAMIAGLALLGAVAASGDAIGRSVVTLIGGGFAFGLLGCGLKEFLARRGGYYAAPHVATPASYASTPVGIFAMPPLADATASEFDEVKQPAFAAVVSLTEAQVERQRAEQRARERRATLTRA